MVNGQVFEGDIGGAIERNGSIGGAIGNNRIRRGFEDDIVNGRSTRNGNNSQLFVIGTAFYGKDNGAGNTSKSLARYGYRQRLQKVCLCQAAYNIMSRKGVAIGGKVCWLKRLTSAAARMVVSLFIRMVLFLKYNTGNISYKRWLVKGLIC